MPDALEAIVLGLAAWRIWHLIAEDAGPWDILDRARSRLLRLPRGWKEGDPVPDDYRYGLREFLECPFCSGLWIAGAWVAFYAIWPTAALWSALLLAVNAAVIFVNHWLSSE